MHLLEPLADDAERLAEPRLERALQPLVHGDAHLLEARGVVLLERRAAAPRPTGASASIRRSLDSENVPSCATSELPQARDRLAHLLAQRPPLPGGFGPPLRQFVAQRALDVRLRRLRATPGAPRARPGPRARGAAASTSRSARTATSRTTTARRAGFPSGGIVAQAGGSVRYGLRLAAGDCDWRPAHAGSSGDPAAAGRLDRLGRSRQVASRRPDLIRFPPMLTRPIRLLTFAAAGDGARGTLRARGREAAAPGHRRSRPEGPRGAARPRRHHRHEDGRTDHAGRAGGAAVDDAPAARRRGAHERRVPQGPVPGAPGAGQVGPARASSASRCTRTPSSGSSTSGATACSPRKGSCASPAGTRTGATTGSTTATSSCWRATTRCRCSRSTRRARSWRPSAGRGSPTSRPRKRPTSRRTSTWTTPIT